MFTIKHIDKCGDERMVECHRFTKERRSDGFAQFMALDLFPNPGEYIETWCGDDGPSNDLSCHTIYVMNRFGATVATHRFGDPDFSRDPRCAQADLSQLVPAHQ